MENATQVRPTERVDIELRDMGCRYLGKVGGTKIAPAASESIHKYLTPNGQILLVHDYGENKGWDIYAPICAENDIHRTLSAVREFVNGK